VSEAGERADGLLSRWSRRKAQQRRGSTAPSAAPVAAPPIEAEAAPVAPAPALAPAVEVRVPVPTLEDVARLGLDSEYGRFVACDVPADVKNAALQKLFTDPHFNVMDGLDTYIDDYGKPDPIPLAMLRQMAQAQALGLFADAAKAAADLPVAGATPDGAVAVVAAQSPTEPVPAIADDQDPALRLQPLDAAGPPGAAGGAGQDDRREH
jgi:hypothetical protein